ncbi:MAG: hypothetical protein CTY31_05995 [Hyphomicrobium sp.]|nr:MAG: hypothetical protein CTY39_10675 [Hyphomicrobium sp.]PPD00642.1 MAG: hypothetical protein CTY31_05995 [Hyphomicrobium sp.]
MSRPNLVLLSKPPSRHGHQGLAASRPVLKGTPVIIGAQSNSRVDGLLKTSTLKSSRRSFSHGVLVDIIVPVELASANSTASNTLWSHRATPAVLVIAVLMGTAGLATWPVRNQQSAPSSGARDIAIAAPSSSDPQKPLRREVQAGQVLAIASPEPDELQPTGAPDLIETEALSSLIPAIVEESEVYEGLERRCSLDEVADEPGQLQLSALATSETTTRDFGAALAQAAQSQIGEFVVYTDSYKRLSFPMGDVPSLFGVCTDVVIRAYRAVGLDLQGLVHRARVGSGDTSIDHRRTEVLRRFFAAQGRSLPVTDVAEDYLPGDIVTYHRPQNRGSQSHIAIVSNEIGSSGRPLIIHNRGWGPQLEDGLFVDRITGHYRYSGPSKTQPIQVIRQVRRTLSAKRAAAALRKSALRSSRARLTKLSSAKSKDGEGLQQKKSSDGF